MRDLRNIIADNGNDDTPAMDTHNLTGRAIRCDFCGDPATTFGMENFCDLCNRLFEYESDAPFAFNN